MSAISAKDPEHTRRQLLQAAYDEIHEHGYQAASLDRILGKTKVTKGALYHHFSSKHALGLAVVDEMISQDVQRCRIDAVLSSAGDPFEAILGAAAREIDSLTEMEKLRGCPLDNLIHEMSPLDLQFQQRLQAIVIRWQSALAEVLRRGIEQNFVRKDVDCDSAAWFIVEVYCGVLGLSKVMDKQILYGAAFVQARLYFNTLKP